MFISCCPGWEIVTAGNRSERVCPGSKTGKPCVCSALPSMTIVAWTLVRGTKKRLESDTETGVDLPGTTGWLKLPTCTPLKLTTPGGAETTGGVVTMPTVAKPGDTGPPAVAKFAFVDP